MKLVKPDKKYQKTFEDFVSHCDNPLYIEGFGLPAEQYTNSSDYIKKVLGYSDGIGLPDGYVPCSVYWMICENKMVGIIDIRHELNDFLLKEGGHVGYSIHPDYRGKGYGKELLRLGLIEAKKLGIEKVLVTCDSDNIGSEKIIVANGGGYENTIVGKKRFWIDNT